MIDLSKIKCVGCTACAAACPKSIIVMRKNEEGFQYPYIDDGDACVACGLCEKACPVLNFKPEVKCEQTALIAQIMDDEIRKESASGGMFSAIALSVLEEGGVVYGAAYDREFKVCHIGISTKQDLWKLRNSKYVQSDLDGVFREIKTVLQSGKKVCFSGTPCQIEGLREYLGKDYDNLLLVDVVCHGVSSPLIWDKYLETINQEDIAKIYFRWKHYGYKYSTMSFFDRSNKEVYYAGVESDKMLRAYFSNSCDRENCYECLFKKRYRRSDFTVWDCFQPKFFNRDFDDDRGTSGVLVHSDKGLKQLEKILEMQLIKYQYVSPDELTFGNHEMIASVKKGDCRQELLKDAAILSGQELFDKYFPDTRKTKLKKTIRLMLVYTGLYNTFKYAVFVYRRNRFRKQGEA